MNFATRTTLAWLALVALTLGGAWLAEAGEPGFALTLFIAAAIAFKARLVMDHFMELPDASPRLRRPMYLFFLLIPALLLATWAFGPHIARLTALV